jgi:hypothetical protein
MAQVDRHTADIIRWYAQEKMTELGRHPSGTYEFGYGTLMELAHNMIQWAAETDHVLYAQKAGHSPDADVLAIRVRSYIEERTVTKKSLDDARWFSKEIRKRNVGPIVTTQKEELWKSEKALDDPHGEDQGVLTINKPAVPATYDNSLDAIRDMAKTFRDFNEASGDVELVAILSTAELSLLRLLMERL